jgi:hypothetical protein
MAKRVFASGHVAPDAYREAGERRSSSRGGSLAAMAERFFASCFEILVLRRLRRYSMHQSSWSSVISVALR